MNHKNGPVYKQSRFFFLLLQDSLRHTELNSNTLSLGGVMKYDEAYEDGMQKWETVSADIVPVFVSRKPSSVKWALTGSIIGILGMYLFDPDRGVSRRLQLKSKFAKWTQSLQQFSGKQFQNVKSQLKGLEAGFNQIQNTATNAPIRPSNKSKNRDQSFN